MFKGFWGLCPVAAHHVSPLVVYLEERCVRAGQGDRKRVMWLSYICLSLSRPVCLHMKSAADGYFVHTDTYTKHYRDLQ